MVVVCDCCLLLVIVVLGSFSRSYGLLVWHISVAERTPWQSKLGCATQSFSARRAPILSLPACCVESTRFRKFDNGLGFIDIGGRSWLAFVLCWLPCRLRMYGRMSDLQCETASLANALEFVKLSIEACSRVAHGLKLLRAGWNPTQPDAQAVPGHSTGALARSGQLQLVEGIDLLLAAGKIWLPTQATPSYGK